MFAEAEPLLKEAIEIRQRTQPDMWTTYNTVSMLGGVLMQQNKNAEAEPLLIKGYEGLAARESSIPPQGRLRVAEALQRLIKFYRATDKTDQAEKYSRLLTEFESRDAKP